MSSGSRARVSPRPRDERVDVAQRRAGTVVGEPRGDHRRGRRGGPAGEPQAEVVDRLEDHDGLRVDVGQPLAQQQRVAGGVGAARRRRPAGDADERQHLVRREAGDVDRPADDLTREVAGAGVGPQQDVAGGLAVGADGHRRSPLSGDRDRVQPVAAGSGARDRLARRLAQLVPPLDGVLRRRTVEPDVHVDGAYRRARAPRPRASTRRPWGRRCRGRWRGSSARPCQDAGASGRPRASRRGSAPSRTSPCHCRRACRRSRTPRPTWRARPCAPRRTRPRRAAPRGTTRRDPARCWAA